MTRYYTRACNFFYGQNSKKLVENKKALPLCGNSSISFNQIEIFIRDKNKINSKIINVRDIKKTSPVLRKKIKKDLKKITERRGFFRKKSLFLSIKCQYSPSITSHHSPFLKSIIFRKYADPQIYGFVAKIPPSLNKPIP